MIYEYQQMILAIFWSLLIGISLGNLIRNHVMTKRLSERGVIHYRRDGKLVWSDNDREYDL